ncbi:hypothetical protein CPLU01_12751 [Colletotrichum plurivorum]|uniref:Uncharacterized protein n=1 Tax=Colletotrichum plurivorum TaxID=2175906 RepID=A0A8H6N4S7_9PEZI|nr:hypothetical protein CPLU01_12751 [Colletotrichum plurivorum]
MRLDDLPPLARVSVSSVWSIPPPSRLHPDPFRLPSAARRRTLIVYSDASVASVILCSMNRHDVESDARLSRIMLPSISSQPFPGFDTYRDRIGQTPRGYLRDSRVTTKYLSRGKLAKRYSYVRLDVAPRLGLVGGRPITGFSSLTSAPYQDHSQARNLVLRALPRELAGLSILAGLGRVRVVWPAPHAHAKKQPWESGTTLRRPGGALAAHLHLAPSSSIILHASPVSSPSKRAPFSSSSNAHSSAASSSTAVGIKTARRKIENDSTTRVWRTNGCMAWRARCVSRATWATYLRHNGYRPHGRGALEPHPTTHWLRGFSAWTISAPADEGANQEARWALRRHAEDIGAAPSEGNESSPTPSAPLFPSGGPCGNAREDTKNTPRIPSWRRRGVDLHYSSFQPANGSQTPDSDSSLGVLSECCALIPPLILIRRVSFPGLIQHRLLPWLKVETLKRGQYGLRLPSIARDKLPQPGPRADTVWSLVVAVSPRPYLAQLRLAVPRDVERCLSLPLHGNLAAANQQRERLDKKRQAEHSTPSFQAPADTHTIRPGGQGHWTDSDKARLNRRNKGGVSDKGQWGEQGKDMDMGRLST